MEAAHYGLPSRRKRIYMIAARNYSTVTARTRGAGPGRPGDHRPARRRTTTESHPQSRAGSCTVRAPCQS
ncbi:hypothetical protein ACTU45_35675 [Streptomyces sp. 24-1644]|uniref:hypothetical protein n=1 Tax=Streptomyces sp. 24-1644 TaxID=3457315 RepID=UPI003FA6F2DF